MTEAIEKLLEKLEVRLTQTITTSEQKLMDNMNAKYEKIEKRLLSLEESNLVNVQKISLNTIQGKESIDLAKGNKSDIADLRTEVDALSVSNAQLVKEVADLQKTTSKQAVQIRVHTERAEDLANRGLRKHIVIRGIPEEDNEQSWDTTRKVAATALGSATNMDADTIDFWIERIHRGPKSKDPTKSKFPRKIYAVLYDWNKIEELTKALRTHGKESGIYIDLQYGPNTNYRRGLAFAKRRELKNKKTIVSGYVNYPAKLFVKYGHDSKYVLCDDFSHVVIPDDVYAR